jgi:GNAT superfamily N-acetyltransferase
MSSVHLKMTLQRFHDFPWQLGYKHEYFGGMIHVTPATSALVTLRLKVRACTPPELPYAVRPVEAMDQRGLIALYRLAFRNSPEYADWPVKYFREQTRKNVEVHLTTNQAWFCATRVVCEKSRFLAAIFIEATALGPIVQPIIVRPSHQRQGLGTVLLQHAEHHLRELGASHLYSHCHLANPRSLAWHLRQGFKELPDVWVAAHRYRFYLHELERRRRLREGSEADWQTLREQRDWWKKEWARLEAIEKKDYMRAHPVMQLLHEKRKR